MTIKKLMMGAGAIDEPQVIAPSSNDWDYTFADSEWPVAGNLLGDHTLGTYVNPTGGNSAIFSLPTFDGDFEVEFTLGAAFTDIVFGVHALTDDDHRTNSGSAGMDAMTNSFWFDQEQNDFFIGNTDEVNDVYTWDSGDVVKITRESGTIKMWDNDSLVMTFGTTYSGSMRFALCADTVGGTVDVDNLKFTDTDKVQRDGFFNEGAASAMSGSSAFNGARIVATRSGVVTSVKFNVDSVSSSYNGHCEIWVGDGTNPTAQLGSDSDTVAMSSTGDKTFTFSAGDAIIKKGQFIWAIIAQETSGSINLSCVDTFGQSRSGLGSAATSLSDEDRDYKMEMVVDTSDGEPTPDHDTLLLIHSDTSSDGSTTFADSSQSGRTITVAGNAQHDTAQKPFGASSILFDGTGDYLTVPDSNDWAFSNAFTIDFWMRAAGVGVNQPVIGQWSSGSNSGIAWYIFIHSSNVIEFTFGNGSSSTTASSTSTLAATTWYHIACVYDGGNMGLWHNGTSQTTTSSTIVTNNLGLVVDIGRDFAGRYFDGHLHEIRISNVARWEPGVAFTPPTSAYP